MPDILISEDIRGVDVDRLSEKFDVRFAPELWRDPAQLLRVVADVRALIVRNQTQVTAAVLQSAPRLEIVARAGVGLDNINVPAAREAGVVVSFTPDQNAISVAELTIGFMLALARRLVAADTSTRAGNWNRQAFTGCELHGKTLGVLGIGRIGVRTALRARAFGMSILAFDAYAHPDSVNVAECGAELTSLDRVLAEADFLACHLPLTDETRRLLGYEQFSRMKPTAYVVNTSRGEVIDELGLTRALRERRLAGAALDVRETEPPPAHDPLSRMENVLLTPHIGAFTVEGQTRVIGAVCQDVVAVLSGEAARNSATFPRPRRQHGQ